MFKIDGGGFIPKVQEPIKKPEIKQTPPPQPDNQGAGSKFGENNFYASNLKSSLNRTVDVQKIANISSADKLSPSAALDKINRLPVTDINDPAAIREYNRQRAALADEGLRNAVPPKREDYKGLNGTTADYEYREAKSSYDSAVSKLKSASASAKADPTKLPLAAALTPNQALDRINHLPVPSLNDKVATREYQRQRAAIADAALQSAAPPSRDDYKALPGRTGEMEYRDALSSYNGDVSALKNISSAANADLQTSPTAVLDESAQRVWDAAQSSPEEGARVLAQEVADINAKYGPEAGGQLLGKLYQDSKKDDYDHDLTNILSFTGGQGTDGLTETQKTAVGTAIGQAYDKMSTQDKQDFVKNLVATTEANGFRGNAAKDIATQIADLVSRSGSASLKTDMVNALTKRMVEIHSKAFGNNGGVDIKALANSAAMIAGSGADSAAQVAMFDTIIKSLPKMNGDQLKSLMEDPALKDRLSQIFINNSTEITQSLTNEDGRFLDPTAIDGLKKFFEMTMFSKNPGELRQQVMAEGVALVSRFADPDASATSGRDKPADAYTAGSLTAIFQSAANSQKSSILDDQKARAETTKMFVGLAFSFVPGASKVLGEGANKGLEFVYGQATEYAETHANTAIGGLINGLEADALKNTDDGFNVFRDLAIMIPSQVLNGRDELANAFDLGYSKAATDLLNVDANN